MERNPAAAEPPTELVARLAHGLERIGAGFPDAAPGRLASLCVLVAEWGRRINLSGHRSPEAICDRLVLDAAALCAALPAFGSLADLGSGAGFPGLPIAILRPGTKVVLVESRQRRHHFQRAAIRHLELHDVEALLGRAEALEPVVCDIAIAQAVAPAGRAADLMRRWAHPGGWIALPAAAGARLDALPHRAGEERVELEYQVPDGPVRKLWLLRVREGS